MKVVSFWPSTGCAMLSFSASHTSAPSFCLMLLPLYLLVFHRVLWLCWVGILRRCKASYGEVRAGWQAPSLHGQWPWREMKEVPVCTLAAQTGLQSSVKSLLPPLPRCLSCAPYPFHTSLILGGVEKSVTAPWCLDPSFSSAPPHVFLMIWLLFPGVSGPVLN